MAELLTGCRMFGQLLFWIIADVVLLGLILSVLIGVIIAIAEATRNEND